MAGMSSMGNMLASDDVIDVEVYARGEDGRGIYNQVIEYQASQSATVIPSGTWTTSFPTVQQGQYLWTRVTLLYNDETSMVSYSISYFAIDGTDGENGAVFTPSVDPVTGNISWTNDKGLPNPQTVNIRGPKGEMGSVKFQYVNVLPTTDISNDTFYVMDTSNPTEIKRFDEYFYINNGWEKLGDDLSGFYNKTQIDTMFNDFIADIVAVSISTTDTNYNLIGVENTGNVEMHTVGYTYQRESGKTRGVGMIDGEQITTGLFYSIN